MPSALEGEQPGCCSLLAGAVCAHTVCAGPLCALGSRSCGTEHFPGSPHFATGKKSRACSITHCAAKQSQAHFVALNFLGGEDIRRCYSHVCVRHAVIVKMLQNPGPVLRLSTSATDVVYKPLGCSSQLGLQKGTRTCRHQCHEIVPASITEFSRSRARLEL